MKYFIGEMMARVGAYLYENGGWTGNEEYEDLTKLGKLGVRMIFKGLDLMGLTPDDIKSMSI